MRVHAKIQVANCEDDSKDNSCDSQSQRVGTKQGHAGAEAISTIATGLRTTSIHPTEPVIQPSVMQQIYCSLAKFVLLPWQSMSALVKDMVTILCSAQQANAAAAALQLSGFCSCQPSQASEDAAEGILIEKEQAEPLIRQLAVPNRQCMGGLLQVSHQNVVNALSSVPTTSEATLLCAEPKSNRFAGRPDMSAANFRLLSSFMIEFAVRGNAVAMYAALESNLTGKFSDNNFLLLPWESKVVAFLSDHAVDAKVLAKLEQTLTFFSVADSNIKL